MDKAESLMLGALVFLGYYELVAGLQVPFDFTLNRVTYVYLFQAPLLGTFELELAVYLFFMLALIYTERLRLKSVQAAILVASNLVMALGFVFNFLWLVHLALGAACLALAMPHLLLKKVNVLLPGILTACFALEALTLASILSYYALGYWNTNFLYVVLRERLFWAPLEWACVLILIFAMWNALYHVMLGKTFINLPRLSSFIEKSPLSDGGKFPLKMLFLALLLTVFIVILPHLPTVNPQLKPVSVDTFDYCSFLEEAASTGLTQALVTKGMGRPVYLLAIYNFWAALGIDPVLFMDVLHPLIALVGLTLSSFYAAYRLNGRGTSGWAALLVPLGYASAGFLAGGFQANSIALIFALLSLTVTPKNFRGWITLTALLTITGLMHPWTHLMYSAALVAYNLRGKKKLLSVVAAFLLSYLLVYAVDLMFAPRYKVETPVAPITGTAGFYLFGSWFDSVKFWLWNSLSNPVYLSTVFLGFDPLSSSVMAVAAPLTLILNANMLCRIMLNLPIQLQASKIFKKASSNTVKALIVLILLVRVLGNLTGLTPLDELPSQI